MLPIQKFDPNSLFEKFTKGGPHKFRGSEDNLEAGDRLVRLKKIFQLFHCTGRQRVQLAVYLFGGVAKNWWTVEAPYEHIEDGVAWETFKKQFSKFIPDHVSAQKFRNFEQLVQGDVSVQEYKLRFTHLSR